MLVNIFRTEGHHLECLPPVQAGLQVLRQAVERMQEPEAVPDSLAAEAAEADSLMAVRLQGCQISFPGAGVCQR